MKLTCYNEVDRTSLDGNTADARLDSFVDAQNAINRQAVNALNGLIDLSNTRWRTAVYNLDHGVSTKIKSPLADLGIKTTDVIATACVGVTLDSQNKPTRQLYSLAVPSIEWHIASADSDSVFVTAKYPIDQTRPWLYLRKSANQSMPNGVSIVTWDVVQAQDPTPSISPAINNGIIYVNSGTTSRVMVTEPGRYLFTGTIALAANGTGTRVGWLEKTGNGLRPSQERFPGSAAAQFVSSLAASFDMTTSDYVEMNVFQDSGGALNALGNAADECSLQIRREWARLTPRGRVRLLFMGE